MNEVILITVYNKFYQNLYPWTSMDINKIKETFESKGYNLIIFDFIRDINQILHFKNRNIIYTSSQNIVIKSYIDDIIYSINNENKLFPNYDIFKCHDNKGYQEILKVKLNINSLNSIYSLKFNPQINFPIVYKTIDGAGSNSVHLVKNNNSLYKLIFKKKLKNLNLKNLKDFIKLYLKKKIIKKKFSPDQSILYDVYERFILQPFIKDLENDFKILVFGNKYYLLKRIIRKNDFRASGSGNFEFINKINDNVKNLLDFSEKIKIKINTPTLGMDICIDKHKNCHLIEFQGTHLGPYTLQNSLGYFTKKDQWVFNEKDSILEVEFVESHLNYLI